MDNQHKENEQAKNGAALLIMAGTLGLLTIYFGWTVFFGSLIAVGVLALLGTK